MIPENHGLPEAPVGLVCASKCYFVYQSPGGLLSITLDS